MQLKGRCCALLLCLALSNMTITIGLSPPGPTEPHFAVIAATGCTGSSWLFKILKIMLEKQYEVYERHPDGLEWLPVTFGAGVIKKEWLKKPACSHVSDTGELVKKGGKLVGISVCKGKVLPCRSQDRVIDMWSKLSGTATCGLAPELPGNNISYRTFIDPRPPILAKLGEGPWGSGTPMNGQRYIMPFVMFRTHIQKSIFTNALTPANARIIGFVRENPLDQLICMIKDCFMGGRIGHPVDGYGNRSKLCFNRRRITNKTAGDASSLDDQYKVLLNPGRIVRQLAVLNYSSHWWLYNPRLANHDSSPGFAVPTIAYERLAKFQFFSEEHELEWQASEDEFVKLLRGLGFPSDRVAIREVMRHAAATLDGKTRKYHSHTKEIFNAGEVKGAIMASKFAPLWRGLE